MPTISMFYGILIQMYWDEHAPPHFHAIYGEYKASVDINSLTVKEGALPRRATQLVLDWAELSYINRNCCGIGTCVRTNNNRNPLSP